MPINPEQLALYFNAGIATAAFEFGVTVHRISLRLNAGKRDRPRLTPLRQYVQSRPSGRDPLQPYVDFCTVLLAGSAGRLIGLEAYLAYPKPHLDNLRLERAHLAEAGLCLEPETDRAFSIIVGRLEDLHNGDAQVIFNELWRRALHLLRQAPQRARMEALAAAIRQRRVIEGPEIAKILKA